MATKELPLEKKVDKKYMEENEASMTKRGDNAATHEIGRQYPDALDM